MCLLLCVIEFYKKELVESRNPEREKLKSGYSLLQYSDFSVEAALKLSTVNCQLSTVENLY
ncbi:MAG: hypothetical protein JGK01_03625 [Microcoleus sp. PH2017_03_ELD_O_A]|uniref:hypothetical protein n=1 Tax=Microcoleus sp. PH2017_16_JOR_D_A TaxID=2798827 RepID=UPI001DED398C|nr:hypothetical protein [Microcoleus sp. PH2017_16_JOR_D_A]MCC3440906.1 hypothetical protein [Microcoleus sp. PH2017_03_ELD_O_A]MCC3510472.1 hypothetical protein [Microcoleus sp. PH2017_17_BER_D_A]TAE79302.1 MAG: hypothetical protein EAZ83_22025 [Oscillatoriales cyanobacterium]TAE92316.1 MAG: hypothetical protein EAZ79_30060 [Oscillatoriales cyanobacterium]TAF16774.1 MAG: hypothetical protein EAZ73_23550 [Oscillatoriales cyanobacterium]